MASNRGNYDNAANAPYWAVNSAIVKNYPSHSAPTSDNVAFLYANTTPSAYITNETIGLFMVDSTEAHAGGDNITDVSIIQGGSGYLEVPAVTFTGGGGSSAAATATISGGVVTKVLVSNGGSSYETVPTVYINTPFRTISTSAANTTTDVITYTAHGLTTGARIKYYNGGGTTLAGLTSGTTYYAIRTGANTFKVAASANDATNGTAINLTGTGNNAQYFDLLDETTATAVAVKGLGSDGSSDSQFTHAPHTGWNLKKVGTGGRAGRVQFETLSVVADVKSDGSDDIALPDA